MMAMVVSKMHLSGSGEVTLASYLHILIMASPAHTLEERKTMKQEKNQDTKPAPFNLGDHVRYIGAHKRVLPAGQGNETELVLTPGMVGVILLSTGDLADPAALAPKPWHCRIQFQNGFQLDITPANYADFEVAHGGPADVGEE
jgi:hypothetical protein